MNNLDHKIAKLKAEQTDSLVMSQVEARYAGIATIISRGVFSLY